MKKFINRPEKAVEEMLQGLAVLSPGSDRLPGHRVLFRPGPEQIRDKQVAIISGGAADMSPPTLGTSAQACLAQESRAKYLLRRTRIPFRSDQSGRGKAGSASRGQELYRRPAELQDVIPLEFELQIAQRCCCG